MSAGGHLDDEVLSALLDGELVDDEARAAFAHQLVCEPCRARMEAFRRVSSLIAWAVPAGGRAVAGAGSEALDARPPLYGGEGPVEEMLAAVSGVHRRPGRTRRLVWRGVASVAAGLVAVVFVLGSLGHSRAPAGSSAGLADSLGTFSSSRALGATLAAEIASLAPSRTAPVLPCEAKAAAARPVFSAPLVYAGVHAEVFAYEPEPKEGKGGAGGATPGAGSDPGTSEGRPPGKVAVVVRDGDCSLVARLTW